MSKHLNKMLEVDGIRFQSIKEARRYSELKILERAGHIKDLELQKKFVLIPTQRDKNGKLLEKECAYKADFAYTDTSTGEAIVEDTKGQKNSTAYALFVIKRKLMLQVHGIRIREV